MKQYYLIPFIFISIFSFGFAQNNAKIFGFVKNSFDNPIAGAAVILDNGKGTVTDNKGKFEFSNLSYTEYTLKVSFQGYKDVSLKVKVNSIITNVEVLLDNEINQLDQTTITGFNRTSELAEKEASISSIQGDFLVKNNSAELNEISNLVPGVDIIIQNPSAPSIAIRGISSENAISSNVPRVSTLQEGIYLGKSRGAIVEIYDMENVDIYRGPQITEFGRGIQSGAINVVQNKAKNETSGKITGGIGNFESQYATGFFNTPIVKDKFFARVAGFFEHRDGYVKNFNGDDLSGKDTYAFRGAFKYLFSASTYIDLIANYQNDSPPAIGYKSVQIRQSDNNKNPFNPISTDKNEDFGVNREVSSIVALVKHKFSDKFNTEVKLALRDYKNKDRFDFDGAPIKAGVIEENTKGEQYSAAFNLNYTNDALKAKVGGQFMYENTDQTIATLVDERDLFIGLIDPGNSVVQGVPITSVLSFDSVPASIGGVNLVDVAPQLAPLIGLPLLPLNEEFSRGISENNIGDFYGEVAYTFFEKLELGVGLRGTWDNIKGTLNTENSKFPSTIGFLTGVGSNSIALGGTDGDLTFKDEFLSFTGNLYVKYKFSDINNIYFNVAKGRRPNVVNFDAKSSSILDAENLISYEVGSKWSLFENKLLFDTTFFLYDYSNFRTPIADSQVSNQLSFAEKDSGKASVKGAELSATYFFGKKSSAFANYSHLNTSFNDTDENGIPQEYAGNQFRQAPQNTFALGTNLQIEIDNKFDLYVRPNFSFKSKTFYTSSNEDFLSQPEYGLLNISTGVITKKGVEMSLFMKNVFDRDYLIDAGNLGNTFGLPTYIAGMPRFYGTRLSYNF